MKKSLLAGLGVMALIGAAQAHYGMIIPNHPMVMEKNDANLTLDVAFAHPMERSGLQMPKPQAVKVFVDGKPQDLTGSLKPAKMFDGQSWQVDYAIKKPGVYQFVVEPKGYFDKHENSVMYAYAKVVVPAFGADTGWDKPLGIKTEIVPMLRPFANFAGQTLVGQALMDGKPQKHARISVTYYNTDKLPMPNEYFNWFSVYTDDNGMFSFSVPFDGWWGFANLGDEEHPRTEVVDGKARPVENYGVLWMYFNKPPK